MNGWCRGGTSESGEHTGNCYFVRKYRHPLLYPIFQVIAFFTHWRFVTTLCQASLSMPFSKALAHSLSLYHTAVILRIVQTFTSKKLRRPGWSLVIFRNKLCMVRPLRMTVFLLSVHPLPTSTPYARDWLFSVLVPGPRFDLFCQRGGEGRVPLLLSMITNGPNWSHP